MDQPQPCTKCKKLPEDILMLACSHDLCLDCASERLAFEMKKKKPANVTLHTLRASSAKSATNAPPSTQSPSPNWKNSYPLPKPPTSPTLNPGNPTTGPKGLARHSAASCRRTAPRKNPTSDKPCGTTLNPQWAEDLGRCC